MYLWPLPTLWFQKAGQGRVKPELECLCSQKEKRPHSLFFETHKSGNRDVSVKRLIVWLGQKTPLDSYRLSSLWFFFSLNLERKGSLKTSILKPQWCENRRSRIAHPHSQMPIHGYLPPAREGEMHSLEPVRNPSLHAWVLWHLASCQLSEPQVLYTSSGQKHSFLLITWEKGSRGAGCLRGTETLGICCWDQIPWYLGWRYCGSSLPV